MFDLFRSRAKAVRYLLGALLMLVAISLVITLIPGWGTDLRSADITVAEIGEEALTVLDVQRAIQMQLRGRSIPPDMVPIFVPQFVDQMITERAVAYQAQRMGFTVSERELATTIESIFPQLFEGGKFAGRDVYANLLAQQNLSITEFETNLRKQLLLTKLQSLVAEGVVVSPAEVEREFRRRNDKVVIEHVAVTPEKYRAEVRVSGEEIRQYFEKNRTAFRIPEKRSFDLLVIDEATVARSVTVPEEDLRRAYEANREMYRTPERVHVRHILLKTTDKPKEEVPKVKARAEELLKQIRSGADFAELARKHSEDPGSAAKGGDLGWVVRGQTVKAFEDTAFTLKPNQVSNVVATEYGFHILQVLEKQEARLTPFAEVRDQLAEERKRQLVYDRMQVLSDQARAALQKDPRGAERIARELGIDFVRVPPAAAGDPIPQIGRSRELEEALLPLRAGEVTPVVQVAGNKLVVAAVTEVIPPRQAELAEVEEQIRQRLAEDKLRQLVEQKARELLEKAKASGDLQTTARQMGLEWKKTQPFARTGAADGLGSAAYLERAFTGRPGEIFGPVAVEDKRFVCKILEQLPADLGQLAAQRDAIVESLKSEKARERNELFEQSVRDRLISEGKVKIHQDVINRLVANYRG
jgi:peptidyl-prolyl cis-trans isomerase D